MQGQKRARCSMGKKIQGISLDGVTREGLTELRPREQDGASDGQG